MSKFIIILGFVLLLASEKALSDDAHKHHANDSDQESSEPATAPKSFLEPPPVGTYFVCPVSGGVFEVEEHTRIKHYKGRYYAFCCGGCAQDFDADPERFIESEKDSASDDS